MRKLILICCLLLLCLSGCSKRGPNDKEFQNIYNSFVDSILDNNGADSIDIPFSHQLEVVKDENDIYHYTVTIDNPRVAMYNIQMMAVDKTASGQYPFVGLLKDEPMYSMIPNQENKDKHFVKGIVLEGSSTSSVFSLYIQVSWKDYAQINTRTVFFSYTYDYDKDHIEKDENHEADQS